MRHTTTWKAGLQAVGITLILAACGGGGSSAGGGGTPPAPLTVIGSNVPDGSPGVVRQPIITLRFSHPLVAGAAGAAVVTLSDGSTLVPLTLGVNYDTLTVTAAAPLKLRTPYTLTVRSGLRAEGGGQLASDHVLRFKTAAAQFEAQTLAPVVAGFNGSFSPLLAAGDVNGDGRPDLVQVGPLPVDFGAGARPEGYALLVQHQTATGGTVQAQRIDRTLASAGVSVVYGNLLVLDIDGDDRPEILVTQQHLTDDALSGLQVYKRDDTGLFRAHDFLPGRWFQSIRAADLDGDGRVDLLCHHYRPSEARAELRAYLNRATGLQAMPLLDLQARQAELALGDLDRDGSLDVLVSYLETGAGVQPRQVLSPTAPGVFELNAALTAAVVGACPEGATCVGPTLLDIDADGWLDLLWSQARAGASTVSTAYMRVPGAGYTRGLQGSFGQGGSLFTIADVDLDGLADLMVVNNVTLGVGLGQRQADFEYSPAFDITLNAATLYERSITVLDFDGDGRPDLLASAPQAGVVLMRNLGP